MTETGPPHPTGSVVFQGTPGSRTRQPGPGSGCPRRERRRPARGFTHSPKSDRAPTDSVSFCPRVGTEDLRRELRDTFSTLCLDLDVPTRAVLGRTPGTVPPHGPGTFRPQWQCSDTRPRSVHASSSVAPDVVGGRSRGGPDRGSQTDYLRGEDFVRMLLSRRGPCRRL